MRHQKKRFKLGRDASHRKATLSAMSSALIRHKRITTTLNRAKALRLFVEPLITRGKEDTTHNRRQVFRHLQDKQAVTELFSAIGPRVGDRPGGYTRVIKLGQRAGDSAEMALIELVDYNDVRPEGTGKAVKKKTRRGSRGAAKAAKAAAAVEAVEEIGDAPTEDAPEQAPDEDAAVDETADTAPVEEEVSDTKAEASADEGGDTDEEKPAS